MRKFSNGAGKDGHKYIFVIGGVMSAVGKGIATASIGKILSARGLSVNLVKIDPYLNVDAGTMNPIEHGECFVLDSGLETDQDMGNYERFLNRDLGPDDYMTSGMVYKSVIERERNLGYGGKCVEAIPHVRDEIIDRLKRAAKLSKSDVSVVEIGGTVGDFQNALFIDAARVIHLERPDNVLFVMVSYLPIPGPVGEMKTKPTQNAVRMLNSYGVQPDIIIARSRTHLDNKRKEKLAISCNVHADHIISAPDVDSIYDVPLNFERDHLSDILLKALGKRPRGESDLKEWKEFAEHAHNGKTEVNIGIVGKYFDTGDFVLSDAYLSVIEAMKFSCYELGVKPKIDWINAKEIQSGKMPVTELGKFDGIIVPGGFGETGVEGKIMAARYARVNKIPYFGLCYGLHMMVIEYARHMAGMENANTTEINPKTPYPVIAILPEQIEKLAKKEFGGTMRLGAYPCVLKEGSVVYNAYSSANWGIWKTAADARRGESDEGSVRTRTMTETLGPRNNADATVLQISERHRHRYEVNPDYVERLEKAGLVFSGVSPDREYLKEIAELPKDVHPFYAGTQYHPELRARPLSPHPLFTAFIKAATQKKSG